MKKKIIPLLLLLILLLVLTRALFLEPRAQNHQGVGKSLVQFSAYDVNTKKMITMSQWQGKWVLLHFWASWCDSCQLELPLLQQYHDKVSIIGVQYKDTSSQGRSLIKIWSSIFQASIHDANGKLGLELGVMTTPESFLINPQGEIVYRHQGALNHSIFQQEILARIKV